MPTVGRLTSAALVLAAAAVIVWFRVCPLSLSRLDPSAAAHLVYRGADGREHVHLGDYDSYYWLRAARTYLQKGTVCDRIVDGTCHDDYTLAPVGGSVSYEHSLHVLSIAAVHRIMTWVRPGYPLAASAFWVPVVIGAFGVLPAFAIGRQLAGWVGGLAAALSIGLNPLFLMRSVGADNDVWNVVLPLYLVWAAICAVRAPHVWQRVLYVLAGLMAAGAHALTWRGWVFSYAVVLAGLSSSVMVAALRRATQRPRPSGPASDLHRAASTLALFCVAPIVAGALASGSPTGAISAVASQIGVVARGTSEQGAAGAQWPDALATVAEMAQPTKANVVTAMGGAPYFLAAWLGSLLLLLPRRQWQWWHFALLIGGNYLYAYLLTRAHLGRLPLLALLALPLAAAIVMSVFAERTSSDEGEADAALLVIAWFVAALFLAFAGLRFVMLLVPPFGLCLGVALGRLSEWLGRLAVHVPPLLVPVVPALPILPCLLLYPLVGGGYTTVTGYTPRMNGAWWDALNRVREQTPQDTIVTTWWPYGYWVEYAANRRATVDGGSLPTHAPAWLARALLVDDEDEALGLLRMLACGSDATPTAEKDAGAYGRIVRRGMSGSAAEALIVGLARYQRDQAREYLSERGIADPLRGEILETTHCRPPPSVLILTTDMIGAPGWKLLGSWGLHGAAGDRERARPAMDAADFDPSEGLLGETFLTPRWAACHPAAGGREMICPLSMSAQYPAGVLESFVYPRDAASRGRVRWMPRPGASPQEGAAGTTLVATADRLDSVVADNPISDRLGVLVDVPNNRVLVGTPGLLRSLFTQLVFLDGRYARHFRKFDERVGYKRERVVTWRVAWE